LIAQSLHNTGTELQAAQQHYDRALELGFDEFWGRLHRGRILHALGQHERADEDLARAIELLPDDRSAQETLVSYRIGPLWTKYSAQDYAGVVRDARGLLRQQESGQLHYLLGQSLHNLNQDLDQASEHYERALELGFNEFWIRVHRARLKHAHGDAAGAKADLDWAIVHAPNDASARAALKAARLAPLWRAFFRKDYASVISEGRGLLAEWESGEVHYLLALALDGVGQGADALGHLRLALRLGFDAFWVRFHIGRLLQSQGDAAGAREAFLAAKAAGAPDADAKDQLNLALTQ
jgi:tetratricopeptide (TPR) repeat protein